MKMLKEHKHEMLTEHKQECFETFQEIKESHERFGNSTRARNRRIGKRRTLSIANAEQKSSPKPNPT